MRCEHGKEIKVVHRYADREEVTPDLGFEVMVHGCTECEALLFIDDDEEPDTEDKKNIPVVNGGPDNEWWAWLP